MEPQQGQKARSCESETCVGEAVREILHWRKGMGAGSLQALRCLGLHLKMLLWPQDKAQTWSPPEILGKVHFINTCVV